MEKYGSKIFFRFFGFIPLALSSKEIITSALFERILIFILGLFLFFKASIEFEIIAIKTCESSLFTPNILISSKVSKLTSSSILLFFKSHYHFFVPQLPFIFIATCLAFIICEKKQRLLILSLLVIGFLSALLFVLPNWNYLTQLFANNKLFNSITLRFYGLFPLIWFILFGYSIRFILDKHVRFQFLVGPLIFILIIRFAFIS